MAVPLWAVGRNLTLVQVTNMVANPLTGVLTPGITTVITGLVDELEPEETITTEEISPLTSFKENHVMLMVGTRLRVVEILSTPTSSIGVRGPQLLALKSSFLASGYVNIAWNHGGNANAFEGVYERMSQPWRGKGKQITTASFLPIDDGQLNSNWVYS